MARPMLLPLPAELIGSFRVNRSAWCAGELLPVFSLFPAVYRP